MPVIEFSVEVTRGPVVETRHRVHVAVSDVEGHLVAHAGEPGYETAWRSAAKPFQAMAVRREGTFARWDWGEAELALACASHSSEPRHVALAAGMLERLGLDATALACGPHPPLSARVARELQARGIPPTPLHSNCSGKHAAMLALAQHRDWPIADYERDHHPVQRRCLAEVAAWTDLSPNEIGLAVDGCAVVSFILPLRAMARAYARLGASSDEEGAAIVTAMTGHPVLVAGEGRLCTELMRAFPGLVLAKVGASGVYCAALPERQLGLALKVEDGDWRAGEVALLGVLDEVGGLPEPPSRRLPSFAEPPILNTRGVVVGSARARGGLVRENAIAPKGEL
jgi:L-asparaginase II